MATSILEGKLILVVDDDEYSLSGTSKILEIEGAQVVKAKNGVDALCKLETQKFDSILTDVRMPELSGIELLELLSKRKIIPRTSIILMTAFGRIEDAIGAMKLGAVDFLIKPFSRKELVSAFESVFIREEARNIRRENIRESKGVKNGFIAESQSMKNLIQKVQLIANSHSNIMLNGESGTGKEQIARMIHDCANEGGKAPFVAVNCASIPESLIESELFGVVKGAFTGADQNRMGLVEKANGGTLLLDEIGDMPLGIQAALLRFLQESEIRPVGGLQSKKVNVRCIASTHRNIRELVRLGKFREDLMYRLEVIQLSIPPLRERQEDILPMAEYFLSRSLKKVRGENTEIPIISQDVNNLLLQYIWPGNVRELENMMERVAVFSTGSIIEKTDFPDHFQQLSEETNSHFSSPLVVRAGTTLKEVEDILIRKTLDLTDGDKNKAAKLLGVNARTIYRRLDR